MRLTKEQRQMIERKFNVDRLWSYSRYSTYTEQPWEYRIVYLEHKTRTENVYTYFGTISHDLIQGFYDGEHSYEDMLTKFNEFVEQWQKSSFYFLSDKVRDSYLANLRHYYANTEVLPYEIKNETPVCLQLFDDVRQKNVVFIGYVDSEYWDDEGYFVIQDYKTSSKGEFTGAKLKHKSLQLKLYAMAISQQRKIPLHKIKLRYDMQKYVKVSYLQKNGKWKDSLQERATWVESQEKKIRAGLLDLEVDVMDIDDIVAMANVQNDLSNLPQELQDRFKVTNGYIDVQLLPDEAEEIKQMVLKNIRECLLKEQSDDWDTAFPEPVIDQSNRFYFEQLSPQLLKYHTGWQAEQERKTVGANTSMNELEALFA